MIKILFICHGNICRSPMGEFILKDLAVRAGVRDKFEIASAAVSREALGCRVYGPARRKLGEYGISCEGHCARQITRADYEYFDRIYYMDSSNLRNLERMLPKNPDKIRPLCPRDVADPWYTGDFETAYREILSGCEKIMEEFA